MDVLEQFVYDIINKQDLKVSDEEKKKTVELIVKIFEQGIQPKEALNLGDDIIEHMYNYGYRLYNNGNYENARNVFLALTVLVPPESRFWLALAASYHRLKDYANAIDTYAHYANEEKHNPLPFYFLYDCYYQIGNVGDAEICLMEVIYRCGDNPLYAKIKQRSILMLENLRNEIEDLKDKGLIKIDERALKKAGIDPASVKEEIRPKVKK